MSACWCVVAGIATALKILFSSSDCEGHLPNSTSPFSDLVLERNEVIALINTLERFSASLEYYRTMSTDLLDLAPSSQRAVGEAESVF